MKRPAAPLLLVATLLASALLSACAYTGASQARSRNTASVQATAKCQTAKTNNSRAGR